jgi:hypothetical protein
MSGRGWLLFGAVSVLWGVPYALIKVAVDDGVPPATVAVARITIGAAVLLALGVSLLGERPGSGAVAGLLLILVGAWFATGGADEFPTPFRSLRKREA